MDAKLPKYFWRKKKHSATHQRSSRRRDGPCCSYIKFSHRRRFLTLQEATLGAQQGQTEGIWSLMYLNAQNLLFKRSTPVFSDQVSAVAQQVFLGGPAEFQGPEVIQAHLRRTGLPRVSSEQVMHLESSRTNRFNVQS